MGLKQKSDIEHYRNKLRLKAKRKGYSDGPGSSGSGSGHMYSHRDRLRRENASLDLEDLRGPKEDRKPSTYVKYRRRWVDTKSLLLVIPKYLEKLKCVFVDTESECRWNVHGIDCDIQYVLKS